jgi:hypothetical protein
MKIFRDRKSHHHHYHFVIFFIFLYYVYQQPFTYIMYKEIITTSCGNKHKEFMI